MKQPLPVLKFNDVIVYVMDRLSNNVVNRGMSTQMSDNFRLYELVCPCCKTLVYYKAQLDLVQGLRDYLGKPIKINSHYRCRRKNKHVGGFHRSYHVHGKASDLNIRPNSMSIYALNSFIEKAVELGAKEIGLYDTFIHVSIASTGAFNRNHNGMQYRLFDNRK